MAGIVGCLDSKYSMKLQVVNSTMHMQLLDHNDGCNFSRKFKGKWSNLNVICMGTKETAASSIGLIIYPPSQKMQLSCDRMFLKRIPAQLKFNCLNLNLMCKICLLQNVYWNYQQLFYVHVTLLPYKTKESGYCHEIFTFGNLSCWAR